MTLSGWHEAGSSWSAPTGIMQRSTVVTAQVYIGASRDEYPGWRAQKEQKEE